MKSKNLHLFLRSWLPALAVALGIFGLSHLPGRSVSLPPIPLLDKVLHALVFGTLGFAVRRAFALSTSWSPRRAVWATVLATFGYGLFDEWHQSFIPGRFVEFADVLADTTGGLLSCALWWWIVRRRRHTAERGPT